MLSYNSQDRSTDRIYSLLIMVGMRISLCACEVVVNRYSEFDGCCYIFTQIQNCCFEIGNFSLRAFVLVVLWLADGWRILVGREIPLGTFASSAALSRRLRFPKIRCNNKAGSNLRRASSTEPINVGLRPGVDETCPENLRRRRLVWTWDHTYLSL